MRYKKNQSKISKKTKIFNSTKIKLNNKKFTSFDENQLKYETIFRRNAKIFNIAQIILVTQPHNDTTNNVFLMDQ